MTYVIGLTGGIGSGKTVASDHFMTLGVPIIDTDVIARKIVEPGQPALEMLVSAFGKDILLETGELDRSALRVSAFSSPENKATLDAITHPAIRDETIRQIAACTYKYCIVVVPLLTKNSPFLHVMKRVLVVTASQEIKIKRVEKRSNLGRDDVLNIMATQLSDEERAALADDVITNNSSLDHVYSRVEELHQKYLELSQTS